MSGTPVTDHDLPSLSIYTDLPVHQSRMGMPLESGGSAFISLIDFIERRHFTEYLSRSQAIQVLKFELLPVLRRSARHYLSRDKTRLGKALSKTEGKSARRDPDKAFLRLFGLLYGPLREWDDGDGWRVELASLMRACRSVSEDAYRVALEEIVRRGGFTDYRKKVVATSIKYFERADALLPPLAHECFTVENQSRWGEFRIFRDDFEELKILYLDAFELASKGLVYAGLFANLSNRADAGLWADGKARSLRRAMRLKSVDREFVLDELPEIGALYQGINRHTRNAIGHYKLEHDIETGSLVDDRGRRINFLRFLSDFLGAARVTGFLLLLVGEITSDYERYFPTR